MPFDAESGMTTTRNGNSTLSCVLVVARRWAVSMFVVQTAFKSLAQYRSIKLAWRSISDGARSSWISPKLMLF
jgi:hypothetical protein